MITFKNRRRFLIGNEIIDENNEWRVRPNELYFFPNEQTNGNEVKSMILINDYKRIDGIKNSENINKLVIGGFPCFEKNIPIIESNNNKHKVDFGGGKTAEILYNLKWTNDSNENNSKEALLKILWLMTTAELFINGLKPELLKWAYPVVIGRNITN